ncbi:DEKNAAC100996 [Brettanomyces naardenensis]|uniref:DEKNAAC100996 n=1 Tax=Brettanomyces naardenensis TaxID=13370 RepID=A0A448YH92_BRENA|nr:DEKNAAC100996 [Brettanomyces naardenensis]
MKDHPLQKEASTTTDEIDVFPSLDEKQLDKLGDQLESQTQERQEDLSDPVDPSKDHGSTTLPAKFRESDAGDGTRREDHILTGTRFYLCTVSLMLCLFLVALDQLITSAVLTEISNQFNQFNMMTWITAGFLMAMGCCCQVWGKLSINFGRKWTLVSAIVIFEIGSLIAGVSRSMDMFIGGRVLQGIGGSGIQSIIMVIFTEITTIDKKPLLFSCVGLVFAVASALGPVIGGIFGTYATWRWCFYLNLCCGAIILPFFLFTYRPKPPVGTFLEKIRSIDFLDCVLMIASWVLLLLGISFGQTGSSWKSASVICCFIIGGLLLIAFCIYNFKYSPSPVLPLDIVQVPSIVAAAGTVTFTFSSFIVAMQFLSIYFQNILGHDPLHTGISVLPSAISTSVVSVTSGILVQKTRYLKVYSLIGCILQPAAVGLFILMGTREDLGKSIGFQIMLGISMGFNFQPPMISALIDAPKTPGSTILTTAFLNFARSIGSALFSEIGGAIYTETLKSGLRKIGGQIEEVQYPIDEVVLRTSILQKLNDHDRALIMGQMVDSIHYVFYMCVGLSIVGLGCSTMLSSKRVPKRENVEA